LFYLARRIFLVCPQCGRQVSGRSLDICSLIVMVDLFIYLLRFFHCQTIVQCVTVMLL